VIPRCIRTIPAKYAVTIKLNLDTNLAYISAILQCVSESSVCTQEGLY